LTGARISSRTTFCPWCEEVLSLRAPLVQLEADCPTCRRRVHVAVRRRDLLDGGVVLVERRWLEDWSRRQLAGLELRAAMDETRRRAVAAMVEAGELEAEQECQSWHGQVPAGSFCSVCHWEPAAEVAAATLAELGRPAVRKELTS
jgi:hypothetical protein